MDLARPWFLDVRPHFGDAGELYSPQCLALFRWSRRQDAELVLELVVGLVAELVGDPAMAGTSRCWTVPVEDAVGGATLIAVLGACSGRRCVGGAARGRGRRASPVTSCVGTVWIVSDRRAVRIGLIRRALCLP